MPDCTTVYRECGCGCVPAPASFTVDLSGVTPVITTICLLDPCGEKFTAEDGQTYDVYGGNYASSLVESGFGTINP